MLVLSTLGHTTKISSPSHQLTLAQSSKVPGPTYFYTFFFGSFRKVRKRSDDCGMNTGGSVRVFSLFDFKNRLGRKSKTINLKPERHKKKKKLV